MPPIDLLAELAAGADLVRRHVLLPAIGALIGDERQRDEDDRRHQQPRPVIVAGRTPEPVIVRDPLARCLRHAGDLVRQVSPPACPARSTHGLCCEWHDRDRASIGTQNRKPLQPSYAATVAKSLTACADAALIRAGAIEIALMANDAKAVPFVLARRLPIFWRHPRADHASRIYSTCE